MVVQLHALLTSAAHQSLHVPVSLSGLVGKGRHLLSLLSPSQKRSHYIHRANQKFIAGNAAVGQVCSEYFGFPCQFSSYNLLILSYALIILSLYTEIVAK
jgi:hypothetical protein